MSESIRLNIQKNTQKETTAKTNTDILGAMQLLTGAEALARRRRRQKTQEILYCDYGFDQEESEYNLSTLGRLRASQFGIFLILCLHSKVEDALLSKDVPDADADKEWRPSGERCCCC